MWIELVRQAVQFLPTSKGHSLHSLQQGPDQQEQHIQKGEYVLGYSGHHDQQQIGAQPQTNPGAKGAQLTGGHYGIYRDMPAIGTPKRAMDKEGCQTYSSGKDTLLHDPPGTQLFQLGSKQGHAHD